MLLWNYKGNLQAVTRKKMSSGAEEFEKKIEKLDEVLSKTLVTVQVFFLNTVKCYLQNLHKLFV